MTVAHTFHEGRMLVGAAVHESLRTCFSEASWRNKLRINKKEKHIFVEKTSTLTLWLSGFFRKLLRF
jgi:hypothetical protein